jgi:branched-chain amino acid transport system permease protein
LFYFIGIAVIIIIVLIATRLENSPIGRAWTAIREDEVAAIAMGVPLVRMKLTAFAMGACFAGAIGALYAAKQTFVSPESFSLIQSISILAMVIVGGIGSIQGVLLGAAVVTLLNLQVLTNLSLQINAWRNVKAVVPQSAIIIVAIIIALFLLRLAWNNLKPWIRSRDSSSIKPFNIVMGIIWILLAVVVIGIALSSGDFPIQNWPSQLEPAKYQRFVFGILLIVMMIFRPAGLLPEARRRLELQGAKVEKQADVEA